MAPVPAPARPITRSVAISRHSVPPVPRKGLACSSKGQTTVRVLTHPAHGKLTVENGQAFTNFPKDNQRYDCNTRRSDGTLVFYEPSSDYTGGDSATIYIIYPSGAAQTRHYSLEVK
jgi:hypothetical protein